MYLSSCILCGQGPIKQLKLNFEVNEVVKPIIIVGENGTGKSILLSYIVDALFEFSKQSFNDIVEKTLNNPNPYYRISGGFNQMLSNQYGLTVLNFTHKDNDEIKSFKYVEKTGSLEWNETKKIIEDDLSGVREWTVAETIKFATQNKETFDNIFTRQVFSFFPPNRFEHPHWQNMMTYNKNSEKIAQKQRFNGILGKPIICETNFQENKIWLLDIFLDSRVDVIENETGYSVSEFENFQDKKLLKITLEHINKIICLILKNADIGLKLGYRNRNNGRLYIGKQNGEVVIPSLDHLSTGQAVLLNLFCNIIRYADLNDINKSFNLKDIEGIVIIDEIELHLNSDLTYDVLPKLLALFPKIQFFISTHSPLFVLGAEKCYGNDGINIINMPSGELISSERFSEFEKSYEYYKNTIKYEYEIDKYLANINLSKTIIITEGSTDWKHMKKAFCILAKEENSKYGDLNIEFFEYEDKNSTEDSRIKTEMGDSNLVNLCKKYSLINQPRKVIFIGDRDTPVTKELSQNGENYKEWGNNVYSFEIPVPLNRAKNPNICIEHYYTDDEIKTLHIERNSNGVEMKLRLFLGNEFDEEGFHLTDNFVCGDKNKCGTDKINIIDGSKNAKVKEFRKKENLCLSKNKFANNVLAGENNFDTLKFDNFKLIFDIIREICEAT